MSAPALAVDPAELITAYIAACRADDEWAELRLLAEAARYDAAHPGEPVPLVDEMHGTQLRRAV